MTGAVPQEPLVHCCGVAKCFGSLTALRGVDATLGAGRIVGLVGRNGAGKSTLMRAIAGVISVDAGQITVAGAPAGSDAARATVTLLPETPDLYPSLTVGEHLRFMALAFGVADGRRRGRRLLDELDLAEHEDRLPAELSLGMRRKTSLAMALLRGSRALLLDEPFNGLDPQASQELRDRLAELAAGGAAVLISMHGLRELEALADEYLLLERGSVVAAGPASVVKRVANVAPEAALEEAYLALVGGGDV